MSFMIDNDFDTVVSTVSHNIAGIYQSSPINFEIFEPHISSQDMKPIETYATVLMGWKYSIFKDNMKELPVAIALSTLPSTCCFAW